MIKNKLNNNTSGMTLVEVLITLAILSIMIMPIFDVFVETKEINHRTALTVSANFVGQKVLEELKFEPELEVGKTVRSEDEFDVTVDIKEISNELTFRPDGSSVKTGSGITLPTPDLEVEYRAIEIKTEKKTETKMELLIDNNKINFTDNRFILTFHSSETGKLNSTLTVNPETSNTNHPLGVIDITPSSPTVVTIKVSGNVIKSTWSLVNDSAFTIDLYEVDDSDHLVTLIPEITEDEGRFNIHQSKRSHSATGTNETKLYTIEIEVRKNGKLYERLISTAKK